MYIFVCVVCDAPHSSAPHYGTLSPLHRCAPQQDWQSPGLGKIVGLQYLNRLSHRAMEKVDHLIVHLHPVDDVGLVLVRFVVGLVAIQVMMNKWTGHSSLSDQLPQQS